jgi:energy-coupling factor transporter transmembrane protein EcfT
MNFEKNIPKKSLFSLAQFISGGFVIIFFVFFLAASLKRKTGAFTDIKSLEKVLSQDIFLLHVEPTDLSDRLAWNLVRFFRQRKIQNVPAPEIAIKILEPPTRRLRDVVLVVRADEALHRNVNHEFSLKSREGLH